MIPPGQLTGVILAAGWGTRAYPYTHRLPKGMLDICGQPLLQSTLELMARKLAIKNVVIVVSEQGETIRDFFGDGASLGLSIHYVLNTHVAEGPVRSLLMAQEAVTTEFMVVILSDELYVDSDHEQLLSFDSEQFDIAIVAKEGSLQRDVRKGYNLRVSSNRVKRLEEKAEHARNRLLGCGTYLLKRAVFERIRESFRNNGPEASNLTFFLQHCLDQGDRMCWFSLKGGYININYQHDVNRARSLIRKRKLAHKAKISLVFPFFEQNSRQFLDILELCLAEEVAHEIIVVVVGENQPIVESAKFPSVRIVRHPGENPKLGQMIRHGVHSCCGDIIILMMADGTFDPSDMKKLMAYMDDAEMVMGTRTTRQLIEQGTNMDPWVRLAHLFLAKLQEYLWFRFKIRITDTGCIFRAFWRYAYDTIGPDIRKERGEMLVEMTLEMMLRRYRIVELPVNYCRSVNEKNLVFQERDIFMFFRILFVLLHKRLRSLF